MFCIIFLGSDMKAILILSLQLYSLANTISGGLREKRNGMYKLLVTNILGFCLTSWCKVLEKLRFYMLNSSLLQ